MWLKLYYDYNKKHCKKYWQNQKLKPQAMNIMIEQTSSLDFKRLILVQSLTNR